MSEEVINNEVSEHSEEEANVEIDLNATLLEIMVKRTEILEKIMRGEMSAEEAAKILDAISMPAMTRRRRRKT